MAIARTSGNHGAQTSVVGTISNGVTWYETILLTDSDGNQLTGVDSDEWQFQFRCDPKSSSADLVLSTTDGTLTITEGASQTTMQINVPQGTISGLCGDYTADLVSKAASDGRLTHRSHGTVTFRDDPISF